MCLFNKAIHVANFDGSCKYEGVLWYSISRKKLKEATITPLVTFVRTEHNLV